MSALKKAREAMAGGVAMPTEFNEMGFEPKFEYFNRSRKDATLSWKDINLTIGKKQILFGITGQVEAGSVCALMGPSGAGKTSLMNVLAGRVVPSKKKRITGDILVNGSPINPRSYRKNIAYVMQEDLLFETATAKEALEFSAKLRLPAKVVRDRETLDLIVNDLLESLGLTHVQDTIIGTELRRGLSGGEKKRVAIGIELVTNPTLLFLDEPTSGLDSVAAWKVVKILEALGETTGCSILCTIHQPSSEIFNAFHKVIMLSQGNVMYNGPVASVANVMQELGRPIPPMSNPADFLILVAQTTKNLEKLPRYNVNEIEGLYQSGEKKEESDGDTDQGGRINKCSEAFILAKRELIGLKRNYLVLIIEAFIAGLLALVFGVVFRDVASVDAEGFSLGSSLGAIILVLNSSFFGAFQQPVLEFPLQRAIFLREYRTGTYSALTYIASKILVEIPRSFINPIITWLCAYFLIGFQGSLAFFVLTAWILALTIASYAYVLGALFSTAEQAQQAATLVLVPQLLFSGLFAPVSVIPEYLRWVQYTCVLKYAINLATLNEFDNCNFDGQDLFGNATREVCEEFLRQNDIDPDNTFIDIGALLAIFVTCRTLALVLLVLRSK